jgi:predicted nucleic acid-binding protein
VIILDTNVISALMRQRPDTAVEKWLDNQSGILIWTTAITIFEIRVGIATMTAGRKQARLLEDFRQVIDLLIEERVAPFDEAAADATASLAARRQREGRPHELRDSMIAGIAVAHRATLATRNTRHFADLPVPVVDPWGA